MIFPQTAARSAPLHLALRHGNLDLVRLLLDHGADPNVMAEPAPGNPAPGKPPREIIGNPLHQAARGGNAEAVKLLLGKGGDPNRAIPNNGETPLHLAAQANRPEILEALLQAGAKLEAKTDTVEPGSDESWPTGGWTPLMSAAEAGSLAALEFLLKKGADPNARSASGAPVLSFAIRSWREDKLKCIHLLLDHKADPKVRYGKLRLSRDAGHGDPFFAGNESETVTDYSLLYVASMAGEDSLPVMSLLLAEGCTAEAELAYTIEMIARKDNEGKVVQALLAQHRGPVNLEELPSMSDWKPAARNAYLETVVYPGLAARGGTSLVALNNRRLKPVELSPPGAAAGASLARLLLSNPLAGEALSNSNFFTATNGLTLKGKINIVLAHKGTDGAWSRTALDPAGDAPFPALAEGDVVELSVLEGPAEPQDARTKLRWDLRRRVRFPVTLEIDGKQREVTLRGDLLAYDPRHPDEVPWVSAAQLFYLYREYSSGDPKITVQRPGWQDIQVSKDLQAAGFPLEAGDKVVVQRNPRPDEFMIGRKTGVRIEAKGLDLPGWRYSDESNATPGITLPTLVQALADLDGRWARQLGAPDSNQILPSWFQARVSSPVFVFPFPDFSRIQIRRLQEDGSERVIPVDLDPLIAAAAQGTLTSEQARSADLPLQGGDVIELATREDKREEVWKGCSEAESEFFAKALDCRVQYTDANGVITLRELHYRAPRYLNWGSSWIPVAPVAGTPSLTAASLVGGSNWIELSRGDKVSGGAPAQLVFLRDGDAVKSLAPQPPQASPNPAPITPNVRPPRPRREQ